MINPFTGSSGTVEELRQERKFWGQFDIKPEFMQKFKRFYDKNWEGVLFGNYEPRNSRDNFILEIAGEGVEIPYEAVQKYTQLYLFAPISK